MDWDASDVQKWMEEARALQQDIFIHLGDKEWDEWDKSDVTILHRKVGYGLYSLPENTPEGNNSTGYNAEKNLRIKSIADFILSIAKNSSTIDFACIFVFVKILEKHLFTPVFKVKGKRNETLFVDSDCKVYNNWLDYLKSNSLPECMYCYPQDGVYKGDNNQVVVDFASSPACNPKTDGTAKVVSFSPTSMMAASFFTVPITTPNLTEIQTASASTKAHITAQMNTNLEDNQLNIQCEDPEEDIDFFEFLGNVFSGLQNCLGASITQSTAAGEVATKAMIIAHDVVTLGSLTVNGLRTLFDFISLVDKEDKGTLTSLDISHFSDSLLFFSNIILNTDTAIGIIKNVQQQVLNHHCENLTALQIEQIFALFEQIDRSTKVHENADKIKAISHIYNKQDFFESLVTLRSDLKDHRVQFSFKELGLVNIDNELHIAPNKLLEISESDRRMILDATKKLEDSTMKDTVNWKEIEKTLKNNRIKMEFQRLAVTAHLKRAFYPERLDTVKIGNELIFKNMTPPELDRLGDVMATSGKNYEPKLLKIVNEFAKRRFCKTVFDYCNYLEFIAKYLEELRDEKEAEYQEALKKAKCNEGFNIKTFDSEYGIVGKRRTHFANQVYSAFDSKCNESFQNLDTLFSKKERKVLSANSESTIKFAHDTSAVYHYYKHSEFHSKKLTEKEFFALASELVGEPLNERCKMLNQQGNQFKITFTNPESGAKAIVAEELGDGTRYLVTFFFDKNVLNQSSF